MFITKTKWIFFGLIFFLFFIILIALSPFAIVSAGHRGVITRFGAVDNNILEEGFHVINPIDSVHQMDVRTKKIETDADSASRDLQSVNTTVAVNYHVNPLEVNRLFQEVGEDYEFSIISPAIQESVKAATAKFTAEELIAKRAEVNEIIRTNIEKRLSGNHIIIDDLSIVNFSFSEEFNAAIESKQTAEQDALRAANDLKRIELEAQQTIVQAKAEAESIRIQAEALKSNPELIQLEAVRKWNGVLPNYLGSNVLPFLNITTEE
ncbi:TPA: prohibitin family protein [Candidatus Woesearchaeota archaeon]|jgi:regulator of protease activity HflC (stomatin/prohibitin superfamily)|nr:MAG: Prohibitin [Candidatus Uhrbacteria bacterium GW2011_GWA2_41_10]KKR97112.1 MAG: Prohibitin [Candidatus Uhrbacteria bacterium GW2011_GWF2_41_16]HBP00304.1 HflC protein [Candidatus Uhrbacteria bacterium]HIH11520.1 prohibitin family protein [Candidatus Woesearchaeota archaeon]